jgi:phospholipid/cholesterol/gamma-HCH transport system ATP-binding protein
VTALIQVDNLWKHYNGRAVLQGVNLNVNAGEVVAVIGASGCGKSTLLKIIGGLESPDEGTVALADPNFTLVFQYSALFDSLTVFENVAFSLLENPDDPSRVRPKLPLREVREIVREKLSLLGLDPDIESKYPNELSGGMQKRVSFARAIVSNPRIILYDEPTAGLDPIASTVLEDYILKLRDHLGVASIVVTHQLSTIRRTADRVYLLEGGKIHWQGRTEELAQSDHPLVKAFAG